MSKQMKKKHIYQRWWLGSIAALVLIGAVGCGKESNPSQPEPAQSVVSTVIDQQESEVPASEINSSSIPPQSSEVYEPQENTQIATAPEVTLDSVPEYFGSPYVEINNNVPFFSESDLTTTSFETYSELDSLGRCGAAYAFIGKDIMPTEARGEIGSIKPTGWHTVRYDDIISDKYLYNRCHLIGYQLSGENANKQNLITGTRYLNVDGMLPFENMVADYVKETGNHVLYRVTPIFKDTELVARGVQMEAYSVEDSGDGVCFNVFCYNVQPGITIDYATGDSTADSTYQDAKNTQNVESQEQVTTQPVAPVTAPAVTEDPVPESAVEKTYILNTNTKKFHNPSCSSVKKMADKNKKEYTGNRDSLILQGYSPCKNCNP